MNTAVPWAVEAALWCWWPRRGPTANQSAPHLGGSAAQHLDPQAPTVSPSLASMGLQGNWGWWPGWGLGKYFCGQMMPGRHLHTGPQTCGCVTSHVRGTKLGRVLVLSRGRQGGQRQEEEGERAGKGPATGVRGLGAEQAQRLSREPGGNRPSRPLHHSWARPSPSGGSEPGGQWCPGAGCSDQLL